MAEAGQRHALYPRLDLACAIALLCIGLAVYWPVFSYSFFWEDPFDIGQVEPYSYSQLLTVPNSDSYYRPLTLIVMKALKLGGGTYQPWPYHTWVLSGHLFSAVLLFGLARYLFRRRVYALAASLIFILYPPSFEAVARAISPHTWLTAASLAALWMYAWGRTSGRRWPLLAALALMTIAQTSHENGLLFPGLVLLLEIWLVWQRRVKQFQPIVLIYFLPALLFLLVWLKIPKPGGLSPNLGLRYREALYVSQGISFPVAGSLGWMRGPGLAPEWQAGSALLASLALLLACGRKRAPRLVLALGWWSVAVSLAWLTRSFDYLSVSPRLLYFGSFGAALAWAGLVDPGVGRGDRAQARRALGLLLLGALLLQNGYALRRSLQLYQSGSTLMDQIIARGAQAGTGQRLLFVNVPDRLAHRQPLYPLGYWGMLLAPVSQDLRNFIFFSTGVRTQTRSLSDLPLLADSLAASPYVVNTRGVDAHATAQLYESVLWSDATLLTDYRPDGRLSLMEVGDAAPGSRSPGFLGTFGDMARLLSAAARTDDNGTIHLTLSWQVLASLKPNDTVFAHLLRGTETLVGQADGDSLGGLIPLSAWRPGNLIRDERTFVTDGALPPGEYMAAVGLYNRMDGRRYPAFNAQGRALPDGVLRVLTITLP